MFLGALRTDGFGVRLMAMLNVMALSEHTGIGFKFSWENNKSDNPHHDIEATEACFSEDFNAAHFIAMPALKGLTEVTLAEILDADASDIYYRTPQSLSGELRTIQDVNTYMKDADYREFFAKIGFSQKNLDAIADAYAVALDTGSVGIHLRAGDVVYGGFKRSGYYINKLIPYPVATDILEKRDEVVLFCQDADLERFLVERFPKTKSAARFHKDTYDGVQKALFDIVLMSRCDEIVAGQSGFSQCAALMSKVAIERYGKRYAGTQVVDLIVQDVQTRRADTDGVPDGQVAHAILTALTLSEGHLSLDTRLDLIDLAIKKDSTNAFLVFLKLVYMTEAHDPDAQNVFTSLSMQQHNDLFDAIKFNYGHPMLIKYSDAQGFEDTLKNGTGDLAALLLTLVYLSKGDLTSASAAFKKVHPRTVPNVGKIAKSLSVLKAEV